MKRLLLIIALIATTALGMLTTRADDTNAPAATSAPAAAAPAAASTNMPAATLDQRVAAIEAYFQNGDPTAPFKDTNGNQNVQWPPIINTGLTNSTGSVAAYPGAGHNGWLMTSTALVLFMTLPGLALFYGGLVRRKNVLSVLAQCFLITGLVTILYVICGYGMIFGGSGSGSDVSCMTTDAAGKTRRHVRSTWSRASSVIRSPRPVWAHTATPPIGCVAIHAA